MIGTRMLAVGALLLLSAQAVRGQDRARYRDFELGGSLAVVASTSGANLSDTKTIHQRPALLQELAWRPQYILMGSTMVTKEPIRQIVFSFYNDQLFRVAVDYDPQRTEGMTDADMIEALSVMYGATSAPAARGGAAPSQFELESGKLVTQWRDAANTVALFRTFGMGFRLIVTSRRLDTLAQTAVAQAHRLDAEEAPKRELARQKKEADDARDQTDKARSANKAAFEP